MIIDIAFCCCSYYGDLRKADWVLLILICICHIGLYLLHMLWEKISVYSCRHYEEITFRICLNIHS